MNKGREEVNDDDPKQEPPRTKTTETVHYYQVANKNIHEKRRLQIEELDEWRAHKLRTHDKHKLCRNKPDTSPNQLKVGNKVLLDAADPHIVTTTPNEEIPLTVLSIFPFGTVEVSHPKFGTFKVTNTHLKPYFVKANSRNEEYELLKPPRSFNGEETTGVGMENHRRARDKARFCFFDTGVRHARVVQPCTTIQGRATITHGRGRRTLCHHQEARRLRSYPQRDIGDQVLPRYMLQPKFDTRSLNFRKLRKRSYFRYYAHDPSLQVVMTNNDDPGTIHFQLGGLVRAMNVPEFGVVLGLYTDEFMEEEDMNALP
ncbi:hypothetical protein GOBAR_AA11342 [Gossypium barbadense]|uniref:Uncharacterized protein n=1 Tax=Gossypium barbadense TaxID=3634 RepID=A0A2P5Y182_GOSBA|nr:hypothetical protein GOBAR_AA11342 [Gossypium barbadense]